MNLADHNPIPMATSTRGNVIVRPDAGGRGHDDGGGEHSVAGGRKRQQADIDVDGDVFGDEMIRHLVDDLLVPAIVDQIVRQASVEGCKENK